MDPDQFRKTRLEINSLIEDVKIDAENKKDEKASEKFAQASTLLEKLGEEAAGEIQLRSVKNIANKLKFSSDLIEKMKISKAVSKKTVTGEKIIWDKERLSCLSETFLVKLLDNMRSNTKSHVCMSPLGKGIKPSYQIDFRNGKISAFSGSNHKKLKRLISKDPLKTSPLFSFAEIKAILEGKSKA